MKPTAKFRARKQTGQICACGAGDLPPDVTIQEQERRVAQGAGEAVHGIARRPLLDDVVDDQVNVVLSDLQSQFNWKLDLG
jgi:hypothetical protein